MFLTRRPFVWQEFDRHHREDFVKEAEAVVASTEVNHGPHSSRGRSRENHIKLNPLETTSLPLHQAVNRSFWPTTSKRLAYFLLSQLYHGWVRCLILRH